MGRHFTAGQLVYSKTGQVAFFSDVYIMSTLKENKTVLRVKINDLLMNISKMFTLLYKPDGFSLCSIYLSVD